MTDEVYKDQVNHPKPDNALRDRIARLINTGEYVRTSEESRYVYTWADPAQRTMQSLQKTVNRMIAAANLSRRINAPATAAELRALRQQTKPSPLDPECSDSD